MKVTSFNVKMGRYKTTYLPGFILRIKAKLDSRKGEGTVNAFKERLISRVYVLENKEYIIAEQLLKDESKEAAKALFTLGYIDPIKGDKSKVAQQRNMAIGSARAQATAKVIESHEAINNIHSVFEERSQKIRNYNDTKLQQYFSGVTLDMDLFYEYNDEAKERYLKHHKVCDEAIAKYAEIAYSTEVNDSEAV